MKAKIVSLFLLAGLVLSGCSRDFIQDDKGVTVKVRQPVGNGPSLVRLEVLGDKIIHVSATPDRKFSDKGSLVVLPQENAADFSVSELDGILSVSTASVKADVSLETGEVVFRDPEGNVILQEQQGGGKFFEPIEVDGTSGYSFRQVFESPQDEAFYGLGRTNSIIRERTRSSSSTIQRFRSRSSFQIRDMVSSWTAIP